MKAWQRWMIGAAAGLALWTVSLDTVEAGTPQRPDILVDGEMLVFDVQPQVQQDRTLAPMRMILESLGAEVSWEAGARTAVAKKDGVTLRLPIGSRQVTRNGQVITLDVPAKIVNDRTMVPVRFLAEQFGNTVTWKGGQGQVLIESTAAPQIRVVGTDRALKEGMSNRIYGQVRTQAVMKQVEQALGLTFKESIWLYLSNSDAGYQSSIATYGGGGGDAASLARHSDGLSYGSKIMLPLHRHVSADDQMMTVAHELAHVLLNQNGAADMPSWLHEGLAWDVGMDVKYAGQPAVLREKLEGLMRDEVLDAVANNAYRGLIDSGYGKLQALATVSYNVEFQDYLAVEYLNERFGADKLRSYVGRYAAGTGLPFQDTYGMTMQAFKGEYDGFLKQEAVKTSLGTEVTLRVADSYAGSFLMLPQNGTKWLEFRLTPGTHTLRIYKDGRLEGATVIRELAEKEPDNRSIYLFLDPGRQLQEHGVETDSGGLAFTDSFGESFYNNAWLFSMDGQTVYPETNRMFGVELLDVQAIR